MPDLGLVARLKEGPGRRRAINRLRSLTICCLVAAATAARASAAALGVYVGNDPDDIARFERWAGCPVQQVLVFTDERNWRNISTPQWFVDRFARVKTPALWSVAMLPRGTSLRATATGRYDSLYVSEARVLAHARPHADGYVYIRVGWELNGDWFPWAAENNAAAFAATYRHIVDAFRSVSSKFKFEWNINYGRTMDPATAYPGDQYVDVVGMDFYWHPQYLGKDPVTAFEKIRDHRYGLNYAAEFAKSHHKPIALSEWGVQGNQAMPFIAMVRQWVSDNDVLYHNYWDSDGDFPGRLSGGRWPSTGAAFRSAFCPVTANRSVTETK